MIKRIPVAFFAALALIAILILPMTATAETPVFTSDPLTVGFSDEPYEYIATTNPLSLLGSVELDQQFALASSWSWPGPQEFGQSFTSGLSGNLNKILVALDQIYNPATGDWGFGTTATLRLYEGGISQNQPEGQEIHSQQFVHETAWQEIVLDAEVPVTAGQVYTFQIETIGTVSVGANTQNPYPGGRSLIDEQTDQLFKTFVQVFNYPALSVNPLWGPEVVDQSQQIDTSSASIVSSYFGQSFTVGSSGELTKIGFNITGVRDPATGTILSTSSATLNIFEGGINSITPVGPLVHSQDITLTSGPENIVLDSPIEVTNGDVYTFQVVTIGQANSAIAGYDAYLDGRALYYAGNDLVFETYVAPLSGQIPSWATFVDNRDGTGTLNGDPGRSGIGTSEVSIRAVDGDDTAVQRFWLTVLDGNEPPVASFGLGIWWEGREKDFDGSSSTDTDGTIVSYEWEFGDGAIASGVLVQHTYQDDGIFWVTLTVTDDMGATDTKRYLFEVFNVAPYTTVEVNEPVYEGYQFYVRAVDSYDQGPIDDRYAFTYEFECNYGDGTRGRSYATYRRCTIDDSGSAWPTAIIYDKDGGSRAASKQIDVLNVAPWGYFEAETTVAEGQSYRISISNARDISVADTNAGFTYAFDCGDGLFGFGTASSVTCSGRESGTVQVAGVVQDKDGGQRTYYRSMTVMAPAEVVAETSDDLSDLADDPTTDPEAAAAIESAVSELTGNSGGNGGASNGAVTLLNKDNNTAAVTKIGKALADLLDAQAADPNLDLTDVITALVSMTKSVAETEIDRAVAAATSPGDLKRIATALEAVANGDTLLAAADYLGAVDAYLTAVQAASSVH